MSDWSLPHFSYQSLLQCLRFDTKRWIGQWWSLQKWIKVTTSTVHVLALKSSLISNFISRKYERIRAKWKTYNFLSSCYFFIGRPGYKKCLFSGWYQQYKRYTAIKHYGHPIHRGLAWTNCNMWTCLRRGRAESIFNLRTAWVRVLFFMKLLMSAKNRNRT